MSASSTWASRLRGAYELGRAAASNVERRTREVIGFVRDKTKEAHDLGEHRLGGATPSDWLATARRASQRVAEQLRGRSAPAPAERAPTPPKADPPRHEAPPPPKPVAQATGLWATLRRLWHRKSNG